MPEYRRYHRAPAKRKKQIKPKASSMQNVWEARLMQAEAAKQDWKEEFQCDVLEQMYYGHQQPKGWDDEWFTINLILSSASILKRNVCPKGLTVNGRIRRTFLADIDMIPPMEQIVKVREAVVQYDFDKEKVWYEGQQAYLNSLWQFGILKVGYSADMIPNPNARNILRDPGGRVVTDERGTPLFESDWAIETEEFFVDEVDPDCFLVDKACRNSLDKTGHFCAQKFFMPLNEAKETEEWDQGVLDKLGPSELEEPEMLYMRKNEKYLGKWTWDSGVYLPEDELVVGYETYDLKRREKLVVIRGASDIVSGPEPLPPGVNLHPFVVVKFIERKSAFYPVPGIFSWMGPQSEYNYVRNRMSIHRRRFNRKYLAKEGAFSEEEKAKIETGGDGTIVETSQDASLEPVKDATLDAGYFFDTNKLREEFMEVSRVGQIQRNIFGAESATEAEIVERRSRESELDEHEIMMLRMSEVADKLHMSMEENLTQEGAVGRIGPRGQEWVPFTPETFGPLKAEVVFDVEVSAEARATLQVERAQLLQLLDIIASKPLIALDEGLLRAVFDKFPALANREDLIYNVQRIAVIGMQAQMVSGGATKRGQDQTKGQKKLSSSTGKTAAQSRKVASK